MKIVILTQDEPFFLAESLDYLLSKLNDLNEVEVVACVLFNASPFAKKKSFLNRVTRTIQIFGISFFLHYAFMFLKNRLGFSKQICRVLKHYQVSFVNIENDINSKSSLNKILEFEPDLLISIAGNQIFKTELINLAPKGCLNLHTALLPKYRGLMPTFWVLKNDEKHTGVSVFFVDEGIDSGPILVQKKVEIGDRTQKELIRYTKRIGMDAIVEAIGRIKDNKYTLIPNPDEESTYYSFPARKDVLEFKKAGKKFY